MEIQSTALDPLDGICNGHYKCNNDIHNQVGFPLYSTLGLYAHTLAACATVTVETSLNPMTPTITRAETIHSQRKQQNVDKH